MGFRKKIFNRNPLLILSYLSKNNGIIYGNKVAEDIGINQGSTSMILKDFKEMGLVKGENAGRTILYSANKNNPVIIYFRIFENLIEITPIVEDIKNYSREIILFGSCANGKDDKNSDIDLFIVADDDNKEKIRSIISNNQTDREINPVMVNSLELIEMEECEKVFLNEIYKGIKLWEGVED